MQEKNNQPLITIVTVNYKTSDFIDLMLYSFKKLTKNRYKVLICDNYTNDKEIIKLAKVVQKYENVEVIFRKQTQFGSIGHAEAMDLLVSKVQTPYFVTMDSDAIFLKKNWDDLLINRIDSSTKVIGTTLPQTIQNNKPLDFPLVFAVLYETDTYKNLDPSFMPGDITKEKDKDTGWQIREKYLQNGFKGKVFGSENTKFTLDTPFKTLYCAVYYLEDSLIASHFGRGSSGGVAKYNTKWWFRLPILSRFIRKYIGSKEKKQWIDICCSIINKQVDK